MSIEWNQIDYFNDSALTELSSGYIEEEKRLLQLFNFSNCISTKDLKHRMEENKKKQLIKYVRNGRVNITHQITYKNGLDIYKRTLNKTLYAIIEKVSDLLVERSIKEFRLVVIQDCTDATDSENANYICINAFIWDEGQIESYKLVCECPK
jgi:hypothetical protein